MIQKAALPSLASPCLTRGMANDGSNGVEGWTFLDIELTEMCHPCAAVKTSSSADADADAGGMRTLARGPGPFSELIMAAAITSAARLPRNEKVLISVCVVGGWPQPSPGQTLGPRPPGRPDDGAVGLCWCRVKHRVRGTGTV